MKRKAIRTFVCVLSFFAAASIYSCDNTAKLKESGVSVFSGTVYYQEELKERYAGYLLKNPKLAAEDVVWHVNVDLDKESYVDYGIIEEKDEERIDLLVNKHNGFKSDYKPPALVASISGMMVTSQTAEALEIMSDKAAKENMDIQVCSGYRTFEKQSSLYERYKRENGEDYADRYSARAGFSEHHTGRAVDLISDAGSLDEFEESPECKWVHENAWKYGFILRYPKGYENITGYSYEPWHITYVGKEIAQKMYYDGIKTFEEYCGKYLV